jgi:hypothetical protein
MRRRRSKTYAQLEAKMLLTLEAKVLLTPFAMSDNGHPMIEGKEAIQAFKSRLGVCAAVGCSRESGHPGKCSEK